jgi:DNA-binding transcriptional LysR family regulator
MKLTHLRCFVAAASEGSFHRAAARLNIAQPALSRQIRDLEQELEVALFVRSPQGVTLSPPGEVLFEEAKRLFSQVELAKTKTKRAASGQYGLLRIGLTMIAAELRFAMAAVSQLQRISPDLDCRLAMINSDQQVDALLSGEIDVGVLYRREPHPPGMRYRDLRTDRYMLVINRDHPLTKQAKVRLADLRGEPMTFVSPALRPATYKELMDACVRGGLTPRVVLEFDKFESEAVMINLAAEGIALSLANSTLPERARTDGVAFLPVEDLAMPLHFAAMWRADRETPAILRFVELLRQHMDEERNTALGEGQPAKRAGLRSSGRR